MTGEYEMSKQTVEDLLTQISRVSEQVGRLQYERRWLYGVIRDLGGDVHSIQLQWLAEQAGADASAIERAAESQGRLW